MKNPVVAVHDGSFHADDVFAVAVLKLIYPDLTVIRTRDEEVLKKVNFRVDVGGKYNPHTGDYDHHQMEAVGERENGISYASIGLVWKEYGEKLSGSKKAADFIDMRMIQLIDANDNGITMHYDEEEPRPMTVSKIIESFNPVWDDDSIDYDVAFLKAVDTAQIIIGNEIRRARGIQKARKIVDQVIANSIDQLYIVFERSLPWQDQVISQTNALYVIYPSESGDWRIRGVPQARGSFKLRKPLPAAWAGKRDQELADITGVPDARFCHKERFIAVADSWEGAEKLVMIAIESQDD